MSLISFTSNSNIVVISGGVAGSSVSAMHRISILMGLITCFCAIVAFGQEANTSTNALLMVGGEVDRPLKLNLGSPESQCEEKRIMIDHESPT